ncbi:monodehydroascorbate reductase 2, peroxisomal-like [Curcuma longa]|uniref:monodehydroascorbate reductase 2, peroxisomal-like n=1 Tax=Curcuma longa TaxID=136217 RepID=UPI003D9E0AA2
MGRDFVYVILGGGVAAGYAALEFVRRGVGRGELCIISEESVPPYERPALSKGYLLPEAPARLPTFYTCLGANDEQLSPAWYQEHGIDLVLGTRVKSANVKLKQLITTNGEIITYKILIIATGARALKLENFGISESDAENVCYLRNLTDANWLVDLMQNYRGGNAVVIGGGYIGMECAAALATNRMAVAMVFPDAYCMSRLFTPKIADFYENYYKSKGVAFIKRNALASFDNDSERMVEAVILKDGTRRPADIVVVSIGIRPNTDLFEDQLQLEKGGIKVNGRMQSSDPSVYAVGDVAAFPVKLFGNEIRRHEHVDAARKTAKHAVAAIMTCNAGDLDYLPFIYSRVFALSWQFYGDNVGRVVHYGDFASGKFGAYWIDKGVVVGAFLEGGNRDDHEAIAKVVRSKAAMNDVAELQRAGLEFAWRESQLVVKKYLPYAATAGVGVALALFIAYFASWYGRSS